VQYLEGLGSIILAPNQTFDIIDDLPIQSLLPLSGSICLGLKEIWYKTKLPKYIDSVYGCSFKMVI
jgi:hypothetical protein